MTSPPTYVCHILYNTMQVLVRTCFPEPPKNTPPNYAPHYPKKHFLKSYMIGVKIFISFQQFSGSDFARWMTFVKFCVSMKTSFAFPCYISFLPLFLFLSPSVLSFLLSFSFNFFLSLLSYAIHFTLQSSSGQFSTKIENIENIRGKDKNKKMKLI